VKNAGKLTHQPGHVTDMMATCVDLAGAKYPSTYKGHRITPLEGHTLVPVFQGKQRPEHVICWEHEGNRAVRQSNWKLVARFKGPWELYDLAADRSETRNLAQSNPSKLKEMIAIYDAWTKRAGVVPYETLKTT
jgi:arylsulfatase A-like enzyme